jgi:hypothetical protein
VGCILVSLRGYRHARAFTLAGLRTWTELEVAPIHKLSMNIIIL